VVEVEVAAVRRLLAVAVAAVVAEQQRVAVEREQGQQPQSRL
jgi:hypothetical protein